MPEPLKPTLHIKWSAEIRAYVTTCDELPGLTAFGPTPSESAFQAEAAIWADDEDQIENDLR